VVAHLAPGAGKFVLAPLRVEPGDRRRAVSCAACDVVNFHLAGEPEVEQVGGDVNSVVSRPPRRVADDTKAPPTLP
jgi:hypothetical protein